jgi:hypothetical protein
MEGGGLAGDEPDEVAERDVHVEDVQTEDGLLDTRDHREARGAAVRRGHLEPVGVARRLAVSGVVVRERHPGVVAWTLLPANASTSVGMYGRSAAVPPPGEAGLTHMISRRAGRARGTSSGTPELEVARPNWLFADGSEVKLE